MIPALALLFPADLAAPFSERERLAFRPPEKLSVSEWADRYRVLSATAETEPGQWHTDRAAYLREIMDAFTEPGITEITIIGPAQSGKTAAVHNMIGYVIDQDPGPAMLLMPRDRDTRKASTKRIRPMVLDSPQLKKHVLNPDDDLNALEHTFDAMTIYYETGNSPAAVSSMPIRYLFIDEKDKMARFSGREASPVKLGPERTKTFRSRKRIVNLSTPTTEDNYIWQDYQRSDQRRCFLPCPHCGGYQELLFKNLKFATAADDSRQVIDAWYQCKWCEGRIESRQRHEMLKGRKWVATRYQQIDRHGSLSGEIPPHDHAGFCFNCLISPWTDFPEIAQEFLDSKDDPSTLMNFVNSWLAECFKQKISTSDADDILILRNPELPPLSVPPWAVALTAGIDMQKFDFRFVVRAWSRELENVLIHYGALTDWEALEKLVFHATWPVLGGKRRLGIWRAGLDTGGGQSAEGDWSRTEEAYEWLRAMPKGRIFGLKGSSRPPLRHPGQTLGPRQIALGPQDSRRPGPLAHRFGPVQGSLPLAHGKRPVTRPRPRKRPASHAEVGLDYAREILGEEKRPRSAHRQGSLGQNRGPTISSTANPTPPPSPIPNSWEASRSWARPSTKVLRRSSSATRPPEAPQGVFGHGDRSGGFVGSYQLESMNKDETMTRYAHHR